jgi:hypothetical protein
MFMQETALAGLTGRVTSEELAAATALMSEGEAAISDGPVSCPQAGALLLSLLLLSPKEPKEPKEPR